jgi:hypothetical protein
MDKINWNEAVYGCDIELSLFLEHLLSGEAKTEQFGEEKKELMF